MEGAFNGEFEPYSFFGKPNQLNILSILEEKSGFSIGIKKWCERRMKGDVFHPPFLFPPLFCPSYYVSVII